MLRQGAAARPGGGPSSTWDASHRVVIGKDTRLSGDMLEPALPPASSRGDGLVIVGPLRRAIALLTPSLRGSRRDDQRLAQPLRTTASSCRPGWAEVTDEQEAAIEALMGGDLSIRWCRGPARPARGWRIAGALHRGRPRLLPSAGDAGGAWQRPVPHGRPPGGAIRAVGNGRGGGADRVAPDWFNINRGWLHRAGRTAKLVRERRAISDRVDGDADAWCWWKSAGRSSRDQSLAYRAVLACAERLRAAPWWRR